MWRKFSEQQIVVVCYDKLKSDNLCFLLVSCKKFIVRLDQGLKYYLHNSLIWLVRNFFPLFLNSLEADEQRETCNYFQIELSCLRATEIRYLKLLVFVWFVKKSKIALILKYFVKKINQTSHFSLGRHEFVC